MGTSEDGGQLCRICLESSRGGSGACSASESSVQKRGERIAWNSKAEDDRLVSPCGCTGTQAYVHLRCLRRWQSAVMSARHPGANYSPALICSVCTKRFAFAPPKPPLSMRIGTACDCCARESAVLIIFLCMCYLGIAYHYNIRPFLFQANKALQNVFSNGFAEIVVNPEVALRPGVVLVASPSMDSLAGSDVFTQSVVLLYQHSPNRSIGFIINKALSDDEMKAFGRVRGEWKLARRAGGGFFRPSRSRPKLRLQHALGGPVNTTHLTLMQQCHCRLPEQLGPHPSSGKACQCACACACNGALPLEQADPSEDSVESFRRSFEPVRRGHPQEQNGGGTTWGGTEVLPGICIGGSPEKLVETALKGSWQPPCKAAATRGSEASEKEDDQVQILGGKVSAFFEKNSWVSGPKGWAGGTGDWFGMWVNGGAKNEGERLPGGDLEKAMRSSIFGFGLGEGGGGHGCKCDGCSEVDVGVRGRGGGKEIKEKNKGHQITKEEERDWFRAQGKERAQLGEKDDGSGFSLVSHVVLHGWAEWSAGQLKKEVLAGLWTMHYNLEMVPFLQVTPMKDLWDQLHSMH